MGGTNQFDTNICHQNKKLDQILNHLHLFLDFPKCLINEYNDIYAWSNNVPYSLWKPWLDAQFDHDL